MYFCPTGGALLIGITKCSVICVQWRLQEYAVLSLFCRHEDLRPNSEPTWLKSKTILYDRMKIMRAQVQNQDGLASQKVEE